MNYIKAARAGLYLKTLLTLLLSLTADPMLFCSLRAALILNRSFAHG